jgi:HAMP domain-containing protein
VQVDDRWALVPHKLVGGMEQPPGNALTRIGAIAGKVRRFRRNAKREMAHRDGS